jgi:hypothetical protein
MSKRKSLFEELNSIAISRDKERMVEQKGENLIASAINLMEYIDFNFDENTAFDLKKRLINSIKSQDPRKFKRGIDSAKKS